MSETGHIIGGPTDPDYDGAVLTTDVSVGDMVLHVDDTADFDEDAGERDGRVLLGVELDADGNLDPAVGTAVAYTTCDDDSGTVTLVSPSTVAASSGDRVYIENPVTGEPVGRAEVDVAIDDSDTTGDALTAYVDVALLDSVGDVDLTDLAVDLGEDEDGQLYVSGFPGLTTRQGAVKAMQDSTMAPGSGGTVTLDLTYIPVKNSEHLYWNGVYQPGDQWTRDRWTVTILDPDGYFEAGDELVMEYLYTDPAKAPVPSYGAPIWHERSGTWRNINVDPLTAQDLPVGTQVGDLLVVAAYGASDATISDPRLTTLVTDGPRTVAVGYATDLSNVSCNVVGIAFPIDQFGGLEILAVRGDADGLAYDAARIASYMNLDPGAAVGSIAAAGHGAIAALVSGTVTSITIDWATDMPAYTDWGGEGDTSTVSNFGYCSTNPPPSQTNPTNAKTCVTVIGLK